MFRLNVYKIRPISGKKKKTGQIGKNTKKSDRCNISLTLLISFESLSMKLDESCDTIGRKTGLNGSNWKRSRSNTCILMRSHLD